MKYLFISIFLISSTVFSEGYTLKWYNFITVLDSIEFNSIKGVVEAGVQKVSIVSGTGRWAEVVGVQCLGAYSTITPFDEGTLSNATAMWKGKCDVADKTLDRLINFNR